MPHKPVLLNEAVDGLALRPGMTVLDGTLGAGGHAALILERIGPEGRYVALDQDPEALETCRRRFENAANISFHHANFRESAVILDSLNIPLLDAVILDIGFSSDQLENGRRGFSFEREGPLDMRMNPALETTARDLVNDLSQTELEELFWTLGEERRSRSFAQAVCRYRAEKPIETTQELVEAINSVLPPAFKAPKGRRPSFARKHPATRVFQALRIAVNDELGALKDTLPVLWQRLRTGGRFALITFHSLEDRMAKMFFREKKQNKEARWINKNVITAAREEILENSRARSAKLRIVEKIDAGIR